MRLPPSVSSVSEKALPCSRSRPVISSIPFDHRFRAGTAIDDDDLLLGGHQRFGALEPLLQQADFGDLLAVAALPAAMRIDVNDADRGGKHDEAEEEQAERSRRIEGKRRRDLIADEELQPEPRILRIGDAHNEDGGDADGTKARGKAEPEGTLPLRPGLVERHVLSRGSAEMQIRANHLDSTERCKALGSG
jgi:hypothetical protein